MKITAFLLSAIVAVVVAQSDSTDEQSLATKKCLKEGKLCEGFAGPIGKCCPGLYCNPEGADNSICRKVPKDCLPKDALCAGFGGPVGECCPGLTCVYRNPDDAICMETEEL